MRAILSVFAIATLTIACGNNAEQAPPATPTTSATPAAAPDAKGAGEAAKTEGHEHGAAGHDDHGKMKPEIHAFHESIAPVWHTKPGADRVTKACASTSDLSAKAADVKDAELTANVEAVKAACATPDKKDVETKLSAVHDRFHKLAEQK